ncbi:hypothetical protein CC79DRAFT_1340284 [Sarocladium strictum]
MGLLSNPLRRQQPSLPTYERVTPQSKERFSDDDFTSSEDDYDDDDIDDDDLAQYPTGTTPGSSRNTSGSMSSGRLLVPKRNVQSQRQRPSRLYPYRLPNKVTRYLCFILSATVILMIVSLIRASRVENWKVQNGKVDARPKPPPVWDKFPFLERYYGGVRTVVPFNESYPEFPESDEVPPLRSETESKKEEKPAAKRDVPASKPWETYEGRNNESDMVECFIDDAKSIRVPSLRFLDGRPKGFPRHAVGSYELLNLPEDICFERFGRYGPYGFGYSVRSGGLGTGETGENEGSAAIWQDTARVDYRTVDWADVQRRCFRDNSRRFEGLPPRVPSSHGFFIDDQTKPRPASKIQARAEQQATQSAVSTPASAPTAETSQAATKSTQDKENAKPEEVPVPAEKKARTAVVIRCWDEYLFREDDIANVRSMITELALASGGRYDVHLLIQVKNDAAHPIWADHEAYEKRIEESIPEEFRGLVTLWTETQMLSLYQGIYDNWSRGPDLPVHGVYRGLTMAMQHFAYLHPEYEYFWQWEMDVRYTGHYYDFFTKLESWAKEQPRKGLWERSSRFYFPDVHGSWEDFSQRSRIETEIGVTSADNIWSKVPGMDPSASKKQGKSVWGPVRAPDHKDWFRPQNDSTPPTPYEKDHHVWGKGEEADLITLNPIFDPDGTTWGLKEDITGFNRSEPLPPRRAAIITTSRLSRRLLLTMHKMTAYKKQFAFPEMWPATVALQHGFKAVYAPHPVYVDRKWPIDFMAATYNAGSSGSSGGSRTSIFGEREHNMHGTSWFYNSGFAPNLYRRWLGLKVNNDGGEEFELTEDKSKIGQKGVGNMPGGEGRMCLPPMLLHPVKEVDLPVEAPPEDHEPDENARRSERRRTGQEISNMDGKGQVIKV